jgi:NAD(P)H-hydrate epimerase
VNKSKFGRILVLAGSTGFAGAACLAAKGALNAGAGLVTLGVPKAIFDVVMSRVDDSIMTLSLGDTAVGTLSAGAAKAALTACEQANAVVIGPGVTCIDTGTREFVQRIVRDCPAPLVIDADGLNALASLPDHGASIVKSRTAPTILTPHPGELARLLDLTTEQVQNARLTALKSAVELFGCTVILKGSRTLIGAPDGYLAINPTGNAGMSAGGSGDVLAGVAATFLAQRANAFEAGALAAFIHGLAGDLCAAEIGPAGYTASSLADRLPTAIGNVLVGPPSH